MEKREKFNRKMTGIYFWGLSQRISKMLGGGGVKSELGIGGNSKKPNRKLICLEL